MAYYIQILNKAFGPFNTEQLLEMKDNGRIGRLTQISDNKIDWISAENLDFLFSSVPSSLQPNQSVSNVLPVTSLPSEQAIWFYSQNGVDGFGPVTVSAIVQMFKSGTLNMESLAWQEGQFAKKIKELPQISEIINAESKSSSQDTQIQDDKKGQAVDSFCSTCGNPLLASSSVCQNCGTEIKKHGQNSNSNSDSNGTGYADVLKKYADFSGRARRKEYWRFTVYNAIILPLFLISIGIIIIFLMTVMKSQIESKYIVIIVLSAIYLLYNLLIILPSLAVCIRRLHDTGNSGWMVLITLIPVVGLLILLVFLVQDSQPGNNQYGTNPKYVY
ncbi:MAG: DUF805 domain-containing protein [Planctomycetaceae bacterium]|jgi:uncharacterized membrane protein YhaH (DUF805 family)|nr:DUF805 domain-containing protein [Planctomycetaceae bacterium]